MHLPLELRRVELPEALSISMGSCLAGMRVVELPGAPLAKERELLCTDLSNFKGLSCFCTLIPSSG